MIDYINIEKNTTLEDLIMDEQFICLLEDQGFSALDELIEKFPDKTEILIEAAAIVRYVKFKHAESYSTSKKDTDWSRLSNSINQYEKKISKKRKFKLFGSLVAVAACIIFIIVLFPDNYIDKNNQQNNKALMQSISSTIEISDKEIQLVAGDIKTNIDNNSTIAQTEKGDVKFNDDQTIEDSNIISEFLTLTVPYGKRAVLELSDGTKAWINSGTKVVYPKKFDKKTRDIVVSGEIFLDVVKDSRPFNVHTNEMSVRVLGTKFNVNSYSDNHPASVVLVTGSVEVKVGKEEKVLKPNQAAFLRHNTLNVEYVNVEKYIAWKEGYAILDNESLKDIMSRLSRYYGVTINLRPTLENIGYSGKLVLDVPIEEVLDNIAIYTSIKYTKTDNTITIE